MQESHYALLLNLLIQDRSLHLSQNSLAQRSDDGVFAFALESTQSRDARMASQTSTHL